MPVCTRKLKFDAAHRVTRHESKCANLHGHEYHVEVTVAAPDLDHAGRVVDFGAIKELVGGWIDDALDHGMIAASWDEEIIALCKSNDWKLFVMDCEPTAENIARMIYGHATSLLKSRDAGLRVENVRVHETMNAYADFGGQQ